MWEFARESTPSRRRQRYGDVDYDWDHRVDTTSATVAWRDRLLGTLYSSYQPTDPAVFHEMMNGLPIDCSQFTFIDLGSGKGRTLLMAAEHSFRRIVGVELLPALHQVAEANIAKHKANSSKESDIQSICADARGFVFPAEPVVLYLFNPLPESGLNEVMENFEHSMRENPRAAYVLYHNPLLEHVVGQSSLLSKIGGTPQYAIYSNQANCK